MTSHISRVILKAIHYRNFRIFHIIIIIIIIIINNNNINNNNNNNNNDYYFVGFDKFLLETTL